MTSWRDTASTQAQADLESLLGPAIGFAQEQLAQHGEFHPYAAAALADGDVTFVAAFPDGEDDPAAVDVIAACRAALSAGRERYRATAVVADVRLAGDGDAVQLELEHVEGTALTLLLPYTRKRLTGRLEYGQLQAAAGERHVWA